MNRQGYKDFYEFASSEYSPERGEQYYRHDQFFNVRSLISKSYEKECTILDVGCGNGYQIAPFAESNKVYGLDISEANIEKAVARGIKAQLHDLEEPIPFEDNFFDVVVCSEVLEHLFFPENTIKECYRVLRQSGLFIVTIPNLYCLRNRISMLTGRNCKFVEYPMNRQHIRFFSLDGMISILDKTRFEIEYFRGQEFTMNFNWPFKLIWYLHGGNKGLKRIIRVTTLGRKVTEIPGLIVQFYFTRFLGWLFPRLSPGLVFACRKYKI
jgi:methionine biosynthesis protein MetW